MIFPPVLRAAVTLAAILFLSACSSFPGLVQEDSGLLEWTKREHYLAGIDHWETTGRIAIQTPEDALSASIDWDQLKDRYQIRLAGPVGSGTWFINGRPGHVVMESVDGSRYEESNAARLLEATTGWRLPVESLKYWARGLAVPGDVAQSSFDDYGRLSELRQYGWHIRYTHYRPAGRVEMPVKLQLQHGEVRVKWVIRHWKLGSGES